MLINECKNLGFYVLAGQKNICSAEVWDGINLKISFRRGVSQKLMQLWSDLLSIAESITSVADRHSIFWTFEENGRFSFQTLYKTISFGVSSGVV